MAQHVTPVASTSIWERRLDAVGASSRRCRWLLAALLVAASIQFTGVWNQYFSWERELAFAYHNDSALSDTARQLSKSVADQWIQSLHVTPPLLGSRVSAVDSAVLGTLTILFLLVWYYVALRRENHSIASAFRVARATRDRVLAEYVFVAIASVQMFATTTTSDSIARTVGDLPPAARSNAILRFAVRALIYVAPAACFVTALMDVWTLDWPSPVRDKVLEDASIDWRVWLSAALTVLTAALALQCDRFASGTESLLRDMRRLVYDEAAPSTRVAH
jgi:hypothetical protein